MIGGSSEQQRAAMLNPISENKNNSTHNAEEQPIGNKVLTTDDTAANPLWATCNHGELFTTTANYFQPLPTIYNHFQLFATTTNHLQPQLTAYNHLNTWVTITSKVHEYKTMLF
jgi:hypothetical protein